jgi:hypothetical protein
LSHQRRFGQQVFFSFRAEICLMTSIVIDAGLCFGLGECDSGLSILDGSHFRVGRQKFGG